MSFKLFSMIVLVLMSTHIDCKTSESEDICNFISVNSTAGGLGLYNFYVWNQSDPKGPYPAYFRLFRRQVAMSELPLAIDEYEFKVYLDGTWDSTTKRVNWPAIYKFRAVDDLNSVLYNCEVRKRKLVSCESVERNRTNIPKKYFDEENEFEEHFVTLAALELNDYLLFIDRNQKDSYFGYFPFERTKKYLSECTQCAVPLFVKQMDSTLFAQMEGVLPMKPPEDRTDIENVYLLLFKINGRLKYCWTPYGIESNLSEECKTSEKMTPLFEECFSSPIDPLVWVMIGLFAFGVILTIAVFVMIDYRRRRVSSTVERTSNEKTITTTNTTTKDIAGLSKLNELQQ